MTDIEKGTYAGQLCSCATSADWRVLGLGFGVWGLGFGVWGLGFRVQGLGFRV